MKTRTILSILISALPLSLLGGQIQFEFVEVENFTDFSISGMSEERTLPLFEAELESEAEGWKKNIADGQILTIRFLDVDMAGDIQPWRNRYNADIRYIEPVYPPRLKLSYTLADSEGNVIREGEESLSDLSYQQNVVSSLRANHLNFIYETDLLENWIRRNFRK